MRKLLTIGICLIILGCSKKKDVTPTPTIIAKWTVDKQINIEYKDSNPTDTIVIEGTDGDYIQFNKDLTGYEGSDNNKSDFKYTLDGSNLTFTFPPYNPSDPAELYTVKQLTNNKLELYNVVGNNGNMVTTDLMLSK